MLETPKLEDSSPPLLLPKPSLGHLPALIKVNLQTLGCSEGKCSIYCRSKQGKLGASCSKPATPDGFQRRGLKEWSVRRGLPGADQLMHISRFGDLALT